MRAMADWVAHLPNGVIVAGAVVAALGVLWRKVVAPVRGWFQQFKKWMESVETAVKWVEHQTKPNGGSSLADKVNVQGTQLDELTVKVNMLLRHDAERDTAGRRYGPDAPPEDTTD